MARKKGRQRVRLKEQPTAERAKSMHEGRKRSLKTAPRRENGKVIQGYRYKELLEGYRENGLEPTVVKPNVLARQPMFIVQPNLGKRIVKLIRQGYPYTTVCRLCGVAPKVFKDWLEKGKAGYSPEYVKFQEQCAKAEAKAEIRVIKKLRSHERTDWRVSAWQLERRWPEHWSKKDRIAAEMHVNATISIDSKENLGKAVVKDEAARELARKLIDGDAFNYDALPSPVEEDA